MIEFKDLPDTSTPINAQNLNNNFNEVGKDSGWTSLNDVIIYRKLGKVVYIIGFSSGNLTIGNGEYIDVGILPENCRPTLTVPFVAHYVGETLVGQSNYITPNGAIKMYLPANVTQSYWQFSVCYPI